MKERERGRDGGGKGGGGERKARKKMTYAIILHIPLNQWHAMQGRTQIIIFGGGQEYVKMFERNT